METFIVIAIVLVILAVAAGYVIKSKKNGAKCIGCPYGNACGKNNNTCNCKE